MLSNASNNSAIFIKNSMKYYKAEDIGLCTCTPPSDICTWGMICPIPLRNTAHKKMSLLEKATSKSDTDGAKLAKIKLQKMQNEAYCGNGCTFTAVQQLAMEELMSSMGSEGNKAASLYNASFVMEMRNDLTGNTSGKCGTCLESIVCNVCVNCNNVYVVHRAVNRYLDPANQTVITDEPTTVEQNLNTNPNPPQNAKPTTAEQYLMDNNPLLVF
jgi:hypothetical protein